MIEAFEFRAGRAFVGRLPLDGDIVEALTEFCRREGVRAGWISAIGTVNSAVLGYFDHARGEYLRIPVEAFMEIVSCQGNVSLKDGQTLVHLHVVFSDAAGRTVAGHLFESCAFVGEFYLQEVLGPDLVRRPDAASGLFLWDLS